MEQVLIVFNEIRGFHMGANMAGIINNVLARNVIQDRILGFSTDSASNNRTLIEALHNACSLITVEWCQLENQIPCMPHGVQVILATFKSAIKRKLWDGHMVSGLKAGYIEKVMRLDNGCHKAVEKVMCLRFPTLSPILQIYTHKLISRNSYPQIETYKLIDTRVYAQIHCSKLNAHQCERRPKCFPHCFPLRYLSSETMLIMVYSIVK